MDRWIGGYMSLSDCPKCWDTPCDCGWEYRHYSISGLNSAIGMLERVRKFKEDNPNAVFSGICKPDTEDDITFMKWMNYYHRSKGE